MIIDWVNSIRKLDSHLILNDWEAFYVWVKLIGANIKLANRIWFSEWLINWEQILPSFELWKYYYYNIFWKEVIDRNQREIITREMPYKVTDWHWTEHTWTYLRDYDRFKRNIIWKYNLEFSIINSNTDTLLIINKKYKYTSTEKEEIIFWINLLLSYFWEVNMYKDNLELYDNTKYDRVYWKILPNWESPFDKIKDIIKLKYPATYKNLPIIKRQEFLKSLSPSIIYRWQWWFSDYNAYVFEKNNITILESIWYWNAIYILWLDWEEISKKTKKEILEWWLEKERIIHTNDYYNKIKKYFKS